MKVKQISVFLENKAGRIADVTDVLQKNEINIRTLCIADTADFGILRLIVSDPEKAEKALKAAGLMVVLTEVIAISISDKPGGLHEALTIFEAQNVTIEYLYAFPKAQNGRAYVIIRVEDPEKAIDALTKNGIILLPSETVYA
jgi:hypothetical protein